MSCLTPWRGVVVGGADHLPTSYSAGAAGWRTKVCLNTIPDNPGPHLAVLAIGESGMAGAGSLNDPLPVGYPDSSVRVFDKAYYCRTLTEPTHDNTSAPRDAALVEDVLVPGIGPGGLFCWRVAHTLGQTVQLIPCARGGSRRGMWRPGQPLFETAVARAQRALGCGSQLTAILLEQGINDAYTGNVSGWADLWTTIIAELRARLSFSGPVLYAKQHVAVPANVTPSVWTQLLAQYDAWQSPDRIMVQKPEGPWIDSQAHLATSAQVEFSASLHDAYIATL